MSSVQCGWSAYWKRKAAYSKVDAAFTDSCNAEHIHMHHASHEIALITSVLFTVCVVPLYLSNYATLTALHNQIESKLSGRKKWDSAEVAFSMFGFIFSIYSPLCSYQTDTTQSITCVHIPNVSDNIHISCVDGCEIQHSISAPYSTFSFHRI